MSPPPPPGRGPDKRLLFLLHRANRAVLAHVNGRALEMLGVSASQLSTLLYIAKNPGCSMTDVASVLDVAKSAASGMLRRMEAAGFLRREANPDDARGMRFSLTPRGEEIRGRAVTLVRRLQDELTEGFDDEERATIFRFLNTLVDRYADPLLRRTRHERDPHDQGRRRPRRHHRPPEEEERADVRHVPRARGRAAHPRSRRARGAADGDRRDLLRR